MGLPDLGLLIALCLSIALQELALLLRGQERSAWWASNGRDVANALAMALLLGAIRWKGAPWHLALLLGATLTILLTALARALYQRLPHPWVVVGVAGLLLVLPIVVAEEAVFRGAAELLEWLF